MPKLPTTFTTLDLTGFDIDREGKTAVTREMVDVACEVLKKNRIGITVRTIQQASKHIFGIGGCTDIICKFLKDWRADNMAAMKQIGGEKDLVTALLSNLDDGVIDEQEVPQHLLDIFRQIGIATYRLAHQNADTTVSGDRIKQLVDENSALRSQLGDFPQMKMELIFYQTQYEAAQANLKAAYMDLNKQKLADAEEIGKQLQALTAERNELAASNLVLQSKVNEYAASEAQIARLNGELQQQATVIDNLNKEVATLNATIGAKTGIEKELLATKQQLEEANQSITALQAANRGTSYLQVDADDDRSELLMANEHLTAEVANLKAQLAEFSGLAKSQPQLSQAATLDSELDSDSDSELDSDSERDSERDFDEALSGTNLGSKKSSGTRSRTKQ